MKVILNLWGFTKEIEMSGETRFITIPAVGFPGVHSIEFMKEGPGRYIFNRVISPEEFKKMCGEG